MSVICTVRVVTTYNKPVTSLNVTVDHLSNLLSILEASEDVKTYSVNNDFGFIVDKSNPELVELYLENFCGIHPPSFSKWKYLY